MPLPKPARAFPPAGRAALAAIAIIAIVLVSGCTASTDLTGVTKLLPEVKEFLAANPSATVRAALWTEAAVAAKLPEIQAECGAQLESQALYKVDITDAGLDATLWIDPATNQMLCAIRRGTAPTPGPAPIKPEPIDEASACKQEGGTWYNGRTSCLPCDAPPGGGCAAVCQSGCRFTAPPSTISAREACEKNGGTWNECPIDCEEGENCLAVCGEPRCDYPAPDPKEACEEQDGLWYDGKERCLPCEGNVCVTFCQPGCVENPTDQQRCEYIGGEWGWNGHTYGCAIPLPPPHDEPAQLFIEYAAELGLDKAAFSACLDERTFEKEVSSDVTAGQQAGVSGTPTFFVNGQKLIGAMQFEAYQKAIEAELKSPSTRAVSTDDDPVLGSATAPVTIVEFADFQGPYSARFANAVLPELKKQYIDTGKARLVFRDFPLSFYAQDQAAAEAAECAHAQVLAPPPCAVGRDGTEVGECPPAQNAFWPYHDRLFLRQSEWSGGIIPVPPPSTVNSTTGANSSTS